ncbi:MAG: hypothetical protein ACREUF_03490 [Solimonas sp.]
MDIVSALVLLAVAVLIVAAWGLANRIRRFLAALGRAPPPQG